MPNQQDLAGKKQKGSFWNFNIGHLITLLGYLVTGAYYVGHFQGNVAQLKTGQEENSQKLLTLEEKVAKLDTEGTAKQTTVQKVNDETLRDHATRLQKLEQLNSDINAKMSSIESKVDSSAKDLATIKEIALRKLFPKDETSK